MLRSLVTARSLSSRANASSATSASGPPETTTASPEAAPRRAPRSRRRSESASAGSVVPARSSDQHHTRGLTPAWRRPGPSTRPTGSSRSPKVMANALSAGLQRFIRRWAPRPVGSRLLTTRQRHSNAACSFVIVQTDTRDSVVLKCSTLHASGRTSHQIGPCDPVSWSRAMVKSAMTSSTSRGAATGVAIGDGRFDLSAGEAEPALRSGRRSRSVRGTANPVAR